ncbi:DUF6796 family protein [Ruminococcus sp.]|uniref:DUF6796 family protein n=1 Tax=Ruminococcus sp. TaxID=41978 RepID=UPI003428EA80
MEENARMKRYSLSGLLGGIVFMVGDCLLFCYEGAQDKTVEPAWADMAEWRFVASAVLGFVGMTLMLPAFIAFYKMIAACCGRAARAFASLSFIGVASTGYLHFALGTLLPVTCKAVLESGGTAALAEQAALHWADRVKYIDLVLIGFLSIVYLLHIYVTLSGKSGLKRPMCLVGITGALAAGLLWKVIFGNTAIGGAWCACESLGEGLIYLTTYFYWKKQSADQRA